MIRIGTEKRGIVILTSKEMKRIEKNLFKVRLEALCVKTYLDTLDMSVCFDALKPDLKQIDFTKKHSNRVCKMLERLYDKMELYMFN